MKKLSLLLILILIALGCDKNKFDVDMHQEKHSSYVPLNVAKDVSNFFMSTYSNPENKEARIGKRELKETITVNDSAGVPAFYIVNYKNNAGFNIISAERKVFPILAYNDTGNFVLDQSANGVSLWTSELKSMINFIRKNKNALELKGSTDQWEKYNSATPGSGSTNNIIDCPECYPNICEEITVNNFMSTQWGQGQGFNATCPFKSGGPCGRALTGCVATSMMQVMRYHARPGILSDSYHPGPYVYWSTMPINSSGSTCSPTSGEVELSEMMRSVGESVNMSYGATSSGAVPWKVAPALKNQYTYHSSTDRSSYNVQTVKGELDASRPVILDGGSHMWVTSGYRTTHTSDCSQSYTYLYMNWGWSGRGDGFFSHSNWIVTLDGNTRDYNSNKHMIVVRPFHP